MKLKNKLILIFILFACFVMFNNSDCFARFDDSTIEFAVNDCLSVINENSDYDSFILFHNDSRNYSSSCISAFIYSSSVAGAFIQTGAVPFLIKPHSVFNYSYREYKINNNSNTVSNSIDYFVNNNTSGYSVWFRTSYNIAYSRYTYQIINSSDTFDSALNILVSSTDVYCTYPNSSFSSPDDLVSLVFEKNYNLNSEPESTIHDLFELNLTDKNWNDSLHTFILNTDENSVNYNELSSLIENNKKYCIYITDYTRLLTWEDNSFESSLASGYYSLSGYIDFLISDNAYFYFSPHYNRIKVCSGDYRGHDMTTFTKRFFFTLVASEDSDDTYFTIFDDNGLLWALSDFVNDGNNSQTDEITDIKNSYFVGSNQKIYYANEDNNYILDSLTDSIYYGKNRGVDDRVYNFAFSGGNTKEFFLNDSTFDNDVDSQNEELEEKHDTDNPNYIPDSSGGKSSILPQDETSYTYPPDTVDDNTNQEDDESNVQPERLPYTSDDSTDDSSNWSIWDFLKGIFEKIGDLLSSIGDFFTNLIDTFIKIFVPSTNFFSNIFSDLGDWFELKLGFIFYPFQFFLDVFDRITNIEFGEPVISIPDITEPFSDEILIHAVEFNFNDLLENENIETAHNYYLMFVDAILIIGFINLLKNKFEEVTRK